MKKYICPVCDSEEISIFLEKLQIPVFINVLWQSREEALNVSKADMQLGFCSECSHVYNYAFQSELMDYNLDYENSLFFSRRFSEYAQKSANDLISRYNLYNKKIIEIGCGDGDFLKLMCDIGKNKAWGFDPSRVPCLNDNDPDTRITYIRDYYSEKYAEVKADLICCRQVLEHIEFPRDLLMTIHKSIGDRQGVIVFFEVPNALYTFRDKGIWDLIYEHCSYFAPQSLERIFRNCGFEIKNISETFEGQFICIEGVPSGINEKQRARNRAAKDDLFEFIKTFADDYKSKIKFWSNRLEYMVSNNEKAVVWGAGSKGAAFLNTLNPVSKIKYVVDINPRKQGMYVTGTGQKIISPRDLTSYGPDCIIMMNPIYREEIRAILKESNLSPELFIG